ncbi:MAG: elongation factor G [Clostridia bacterium]|nr:elongation factor G [Clostridia bacterium]
MKRNHPLDQIRNIGIMAHIDAGKTTTTERILYFTGLTHKIGEVHEGSAVMDWMTQEQERGITITSAATTCHWHDFKINIIDTPGHVDFTVEVERSLRILDGAIFLLDAKEGVEAQTEAVWHQAEHYNVPRLVFINKMDVIGADFNDSLESIRTRLKGNPIALQIPMGCEKDFEGVISLIDMKAYYNTGDNGEIITKSEIPEPYIQEAKDNRLKLLETLSEYDDEMMMLYLESELISEEIIVKTLRRLTLENILTPVLCGSAYKNKGVQLLLDSIINFLPSPMDRPVISGHQKDGEPSSRDADDQAPFSALIFKVMSDPYVGRLSYMRVYSGKISVGNALLNTTKGKKERLSKILQMHANNRTEIEEALTGDIVAVIGLKFSTTGDTLTDMNHPIIFEAIEFPEPVISRAVEPKTPGDFEKMEDALKRLTEEDPTLTTYNHPETGQKLISGMGELHLEVILDRLEREFNVKVNTGKPQVTYKETLQSSITVDYELNNQAGNQVLYAYVKLMIKPNARGQGHTFECTFKERNFPKAFIDATYFGIKQSLQSGFLGGYEVVDLHINILDLHMKDDVSTDIAFMTSASRCITKALKEGQSVLLEPIFNVDIHVSDSYIGDVIDDINKRNGNILDMKPSHTGNLVKASVPLSKLFGYATTLRSITHGHGYYSMMFSHYDETK